MKVVVNKRTFLQDDDNRKGSDMKQFFIRTLAMVCGMAVLPETASAAPQLKLGTYELTLQSPLMRKPQVQHDCVIDSTLEATKAFPGPVPRVAPFCAIMHYRMDGDRVSYEQLCKDDKQALGGDVVIKYGFLFNANGYDGTMETTIPGEDEPMQTQIHAVYLGEGCR